MDKELFAFTKLKKIMGMKIGHTNRPSPALNNCLAHAFRISLNRVSQKIASKLAKYAKAGLQALWDNLFDTRYRLNAHGRIGTFVTLKEIVTEGIDGEVATYLSDMYFAHRFDLLGSGWIKNSYDSVAPGVEGYRYDKNVKICEVDAQGQWLSAILLRHHFKRARNIWHMVSKDYLPIDWQKDYKSGYRWNARKWHKTQSVPWLPGVDIKVTWELARMQYLPQMAVFATILPEYHGRLIKEFRNQVLDFVATNPPRMGVNWHCAMDVAIRAANLLMAFDIFKQKDATKILSDEFESLFAENIYEHGRHIVKNLEWYDGKRGNHYLANISGLLFIAAYLSRSPEIDSWLAFGLQELINEVKHQFYDDGGNFESSTSYHRLSGEMVAYSTALILGLSQDKFVALRDYDPDSWHSLPKLKKPQEQVWHAAKSADNLFPEWYSKRLSRILNFTITLTKPTGEVPQIGDNDSGRFFRLSPCGKMITIEDAGKLYQNLAEYCKTYSEPADYWDENDLCHKPFISAMCGILNFGKSPFPQEVKEYPLEYSICNCLCKGHKLPWDPSLPRINITTDSTTIKYEYHNHVYINPRVKHPFPLTRNLSLHCFSKTGLYVFKSDRLHLTCNATPPCNHGHNDKLSIELSMDGEDLVKDPGTYCYTPLPSKRNYFRSTRAHSTLIVDGVEQNDFSSGSKGLFIAKKETTCSVKDVGENFLVIKLSYKKIQQERRIEIQPHCIVIDDFSTVPFKVFFSLPEIYSNGYGKELNKK